MKALSSVARLWVLLSCFSVAVLFTACGTSPEAKGKELAEKRCKCNDEKDKAKKKECKYEVNKAADEYMKSLKSDEEKKKFMEAADKVREECIKKGLEEK